MRRSVGSIASVIALAGLALTSPVRAGSPSDATAASPASGAGHDLLERVTEGWSGISVGLGVTPLRDSLSLGDTFGAAGGEPIHPLDPDPRSTVVLFDLKLTWPGTTSFSGLEPYLAMGPALFVVEPDYAGRMLGTRVDPTLKLGARAGAGLAWHLGRNATLFGAWEVTTAQSGGLAPSGSRSAADAQVSGYDLTYGLRFRY
ncbi:MAG TPA: hypothetical protein VHT71_03530 [Methylomirabilota bacterium]|nr:hypothetical protein [Methylomirabilota bacterium]HEX3178724.1 hypothetical protein [Methylomirabilota bacterium]